MKPIRSCPLTLIYPIFFVIFVSLILSCSQPDPPVVIPSPKAEIALESYIDPYVVEGKPFAMCLEVESVDAAIGEYSVSISYDTKVELDTSVGMSGVEPGPDGFVTNVDSSVPGLLKVTGTDGTGTGPGSGLKLVVIHMNAISSGDAEFDVVINKFDSTTGQKIETDASLLKTVIIGTPKYHSFTGQVLDGIGGSPVEGATITLEGTSYPTVVTDANGEFVFTNILIGVYDLLATGAGRAGCRLSRAHIADEGTRVELIQPLYGFLPLATTPPSIVIRGVDAGNEYSGNVRIGIRAEKGSCPVVGTEFHSSIYIKFGSTPASYYEAAKSNNDSLDYTWNTGLMPPGNANVKVVVYDNNNNRCEMDIPVVIASDTGDVPSVAPTKDDYAIIATTYAGSMNIYRSFNEIISGQRAASPETRAQAGTTVTVEFGVAKYYNGVAIFKSSSEAGPYELCGETAYATSGDYRYLDYSPGLDPGTTVWYRLAYYNQYGTGPQTDAIAVWIQPRYHLSLVSPSNNSIIAEVAPTLTWQCEWLDGAQPSGERTDWIIVTNVIDASIVAYSFRKNSTDYTLPVLIRNNKYEWDVRSLYEHRVSSVLSRSFPRGQGSYDYSMNGAFYFTVGTN